MGFCFKLFVESLFKLNVIKTKNDMEFALKTDKPWDNIVMVGAFIELLDKYRTKERKLKTAIEYLTEIKGLNYPGGGEQVFDIATEALEELTTKKEKGVYYEYFRSK